MPSRSRRASFRRASSSRAADRALRAALVAGLAVAMLVCTAALTGIAAVAATPVVPEPLVRAPRAPARSRGPATPAVVPVAPARISVFGDSLAHEAKAALMLQLARHAPVSSTIGTYPLTALCDYQNAISADLLRRRPERLVLEFSGNSSTPCMRDLAGALLPIGSPGWQAKYLDDLRSVLAVARTTNTRVVWATAPPLSPAQFSSNYPRALAASVRMLTLTNDHLRVVDTGSVLTTNGSAFARTLPCRPDEGAFCRDGRLVARSGDGIHFDCHGIADALGACLGYSAGGRRFGEAIADAALQPLEPT